MNSAHPQYRADVAAALNAVPDLSALKNSTVLITGATGLIGACLTDTLIEANHTQGLNMHIIGLSRSPERYADRFDGAELIAGDIADPDAQLPKADYIIHAASNAHPVAFSGDPVGTMLGNIMGTHRLLTHLKDCGGKRLLFVSTGEIYGENPDIPEGFFEDSFGKIDSMNPRSCYPESKRAAETLCASHIRQHGVDAVVARLCYVYGPTITAANSRADAQFLRKALAGEDIVLKSTGSQQRSYCYVADAVSAMLTILLKGECGRAYNVANRESTHTIREYAETLADLAGVKVVFDLPPEAERQGYSTVSRAVQNPSLLEHLGWRAQFALVQGLSHTLEIIR